jgi:hypothetical protein
MLLSIELRVSLLGTDDGSSDLAAMRAAEGEGDRRLTECSLEPIAGQLDRVVSDWRPPNAPRGPQDDASAQVRLVGQSDSQAENGGSIPLTRSAISAQVSA